MMKKSELLNLGWNELEISVYLHLRNEGVFTEEQDVAPSPFDGFVLWFDAAKDDEAGFVGYYLEDEFMDSVMTGEKNKNGWYGKSDPNFEKVQKIMLEHGSPF